MPNESNLALHFKYSLAIFAMTIIWIATERWSDNDNFTTYLSNAATMTSLFLGVIAILYSYIANDGLSSGIGKITAVADDVREVRHEIEKFVDLTKEANKLTAISNFEVKDASSNISNSLTGLNSTLESLTHQNEQLQSMLDILPDRFDQLESKVGDMAQAFGAKSQSQATTPSPIPKGAVEAFLQRPSLNYNLFTYACVRAYETKKPINITKFCKAISWDAPNTLSGFLICMDATQLCTREIDKSAERQYSIKAMNNDLVLMAKSYYLEYIESTYVADAMEKTKWASKIQIVDAMFE